MRAAVVGAGLAGLSAAEELHRQGHEVDVLEARSRVGGRVHSRTLDDGSVIELGAEFILPDNTYVRGLSERLGLELLDKGMSYGEREPRGGRPFSAAALGAGLGEVREALGAEGFDPTTSAGRLLADLTIDPAVRDYIQARTEISAAHPAAGVPAASLAGLAHIGAEPCPSIRGGNQLLAERLAAQIEGRIRLGEEVEAIELTGANRPTPIRLGTRTAELEVDAVVVAVPATVLDRIHFEPALPEALRGGFAQITYGQAAKLFVPLETSPAPSAVMSVPERYWSWTSNGPDGRPQRVLSAFAGSSSALEDLEVGSGADRWLRSLRALRPELTLARGAERAVLSTWGDDRWAQAAYSVATPPELDAALQTAPARIAFAGEHLGGAHSALMEGALRSGLAAAGRIVELEIARAGRSQAP